MSRVAYSREPVGATPRRGFTPAKRRDLLERQGPLCAVQGCAKPWIEADHIVPLGLGGADELSNMEGLCGAHHLAKTRIDVERIAKAKRLAGETCTKRGKPIAQRAKPWPPRGSRRLKSRGFGA